jgi:hypothetical protein
MQKKKLEAHRGYYGSHISPLAILLMTVAATTEYSVFVRHRQTPYGA